MSPSIKQPHDKFNYVPSAPTPPPAEPVALGETLALHLPVLKTQRQMLKQRPTGVLVSEQTIGQDLCAGRHLISAHSLE